MRSALPVLVAVEGFSTVHVPALAVTGTGPPARRSLRSYAARLMDFLAVLFLALAPIAARYAAGLERCQEISRWHELHHLAAGDPLSWGDA